MKIFIAYLIASASFLTQISAQTKTFELVGDMAALKDKKKAVLVYQAGGKQIVDSVAITDGKFSFTGELDGPTLSELWAIDRSFRNVQYIENAKMTIRQSESGGEIVLAGSRSNTEYEIVRNNQMQYRAILVQANDAREQLKENPDSAIKRYEELSRVATDTYLKLTQKFIREHPSSVVSLNELIKTAASQPDTSLQSLFAGLDSHLRISPAGRSLSQTVDKVMKTRIGVRAPDFVQKNPEREDVSLDSFTGKYVLVDFWASWCVPCRQENPNLVKTYDRYRNRGFEILGVSLDQSVDKWKEAIIKDKLIWTQVSDLKGWDNGVAVQYGVSSVPASYLIDPQGIIVAKDLRGEALGKKLAELFPD